MYRRYTYIYKKGNANENNYSPQYYNYKISTNYLLISILRQLILYIFTGY